LKPIDPDVMALSEIIPDVVVRELAEDNPEIDRSAVELARKNNREAWQAA
jgi:hypothetical protein